MLTLWLHPLFRDALLACLFGGIALSMAGGFVMLLDMPFIGVGLTHAAFLGAVAGLFWGLDPLLSAMVLSLLMAFVLGVMADRTGATLNGLLGLLFTLCMGLAFLLMARMEGPRAEAQNLMWGNLLTISRTGVRVLAGLCMLMVGFLLWGHRAIQVVLYNREVAAGSGVAAGTFVRVLILLSGWVVSAALPIVGGLLMFALLINPALAARCFARRFSVFFILSAAFGVVSCLGGFALSYRLDWPTGATITVFSAALTLAAITASRWFHTPGRIRHNPEAAATTEPPRETP